MTFKRVRNELKVNGLTVEAKASIYSISGKMVKVAQLDAHHNAIDVSALSSGTYVLKLAVEGNELITKIVK